MLGLFSLAAPAVRADDTITLVEDTQKNNWPNDVVFSVKVKAPAEITRARLDYTFVDGGSGSYVNAKLESGQPSIDFTVKAAGSTYIPPGAQFTYRYTIEDSAGNVLKTEPKKFVYLDTRFKWQSLVQGQIILYYHDTSEDRVQPLMKAGLETIQNVGEKAGVQFKDTLVLVSYNTQREMEPALQAGSQDKGRGAVVAGQHFSGFSLVLNSGQGNDAILTGRHEITHAITNSATRQTLAELPFWLNEGLSVYFQGDGGLEYKSFFDNAKARGTLLSLKYLNGQPGKADELLLGYGEGYQVVKYMVETYGPQKMAALLAEFNSGSNVDAAMTKIYGKDRDGLEADWRKAIGAPAAPATGGNNAAQPTPRPSGNPTAAPPAANPQPGAASRLGDAVPIVIGVGAVGLVLVIGLGALAFVLRRNRI